MPAPAAALRNPSLGPHAAGTPLSCPIFSVAPRPPLRARRVFEPKVAPSRRFQHFPMPKKAVPSKPAPKKGAADIKSVAFVSLGCPKNLVDSEKMLGLLAESGLAIVSYDACAMNEEPGIDT